MRKIAILTGGGDAPGLNSIIESTAQTLIPKGIELVGVVDGFEGIFESKAKPITLELIRGIHAHAGTYLGTSNRSRIEGRENEFLARMKEMGVEGLVVAGGDGTFRALKSFKNEIKLIAVPKTIDNDLPGTDFTFGYDTACSVVAESIDALRSTAYAHGRIIIVETMGRSTGWIALGGGVASHAEVILIPERPFVKEALIHFIKKRKREGFRGLVIAVAEGAHSEGEDPTVAFRVEGSPETERLGGISEKLARWIESEVDWECRHVVLGHLQRSRHPTTTDRFLTTAMGVEVGRLVMGGQWGQAVVYREGRVTTVKIDEILGPVKKVSADHRWVKLAQAIGSFI